MENLSEDRARSIARRLSNALDDESAGRVLAWASELTDIRESNSSLVEKARRTLAASLDPRVLKIVAAVVGDAIAEGGAKAKQFAWDDRSWPARLGLAGVVTALVAGGSQGAGIAALGSAVGVPLWLVFGAGGTLLGTIVDEFTKRSGGDAS